MNFRDVDHDVRLAFGPSFEVHGPTVDIESNSIAYTIRFFIRTPTQDRLEAECFLSFSPQEQAKLGWARLYQQKMNNAALSIFYFLEDSQAELL